MKYVKALTALKPFMMMGWRNLWRQKRRSLVVMSSMAIGIFALVLAVGFMNGVMRQLVENTINTSLGHVAVHRKGFHDSMKVELCFMPERSVLDAVRKNPAVLSWAPRVKVQGMARSGETARSVMIVGIDPAAERKTTSLYSYMEKKDGSSFIDDPAAEGVLISRSLAEVLDCGLGDRLVLMMQDRRGGIAGVGLTVTGFFRSPSDDFDRHTVFVGIRRLQEIAGLEGAVSEIMIVGRDRDGADGIKHAIAGAISRPDLEVLSWKEMAPSLVSALELQDTMIMIFMAIIFITIIFSVANTLIMSIMERFHELGVMKCVGTRPGQIVFMVLFEAGSLGLAGLATGIVASLPLVLVLGQTGVDLSFVADSLRAWGAGSTIYPVVRLKDIVIAAVMVFATALGASLYPALKAARIKPLEALHFI